MTDYNWYSDEAIEAAVDGIRDEAKKWLDLSDRMDGVARMAAEQTLEVSAFVVTDISGPATASDLKHAYDKMQTWLTGLFQQATTELDNFGNALNKIADWYQTSDEDSAESFDEIAKS